MFLTDAQLKNEILKCEYCEEKPCKIACPVGCSPADFLMAAKNFAPADFKRAAELILSKNPLGGICGAVCPDFHCQAACTRAGLDAPVNIPAAQATIINKARELEQYPKFCLCHGQAAKVAVLGAGPAGLAAAAFLTQYGYQVDVYEQQPVAGGALRYVPDSRLPEQVLDADIDALGRLGRVEYFYNQSIADPSSLLSQGYKAVVVAAGQNQPLRLNIPGADLALDWKQFLQSNTNLAGLKVAVIGGGAVALDCAAHAVEHGASSCDMIMLEKTSETRLTAKERAELLHLGIAPLCRLSVTGISKSTIGLSLQAARVDLKEPAAGFSLANIAPVNGTEHLLGNYGGVVMAIGSKSTLAVPKQPGIFTAGDMINGATTAVEAAASGKNAAFKAHSWLTTGDLPEIDDEKRGDQVLAGWKPLPVDLSCDFFGRTIKSPFLLSAAPPTDGYEQMKKALQAGWAGGVMKTAFDDLPIHIPERYMFTMSKDTYANCDNVSGHPLKRVAAEAKRLVAEFPDRLIVVSTGGPISGDDNADCAVWQNNTKILEEAGVGGVEYSLSCPQGGDGTEGDIVSQNATLTAKVIDWVMQTSNPDIPKLFKLTGAVTSIVPILNAIKQVFECYPNKKAGVTLANSFPSLAFREGDKPEWEEGIVVGLSGEGVRHISNLTLANASQVGVEISGNGGVMDYQAAADFLALGVGTVQICTAATKYGVGYISELEMGLSYLLAQRGLKSVKQLTGIALPNPVKDFMELSPVKKISAVEPELCLHCGNCTRCPYLAISLDENKTPVTDASLCVGCGICALKCFSGALYLRQRTDAEAAALKE